MEKYWNIFFYSLRSTTSYTQQQYEKVFTAVQQYTVLDTAVPAVQKISTDSTVVVAEQEKAIISIFPSR